MFKPPAVCRGFLHLPLKPHKQDFFMHLHFQMAACIDAWMEGWMDGDIQPLCAFIV